MEENPYQAPVENGSDLASSPDTNLRYRLRIAAMILFGVLAVAPGVVTAFHFIGYLLRTRSWPA